MTKEEYIEYFHSIPFTAYPTVQTMDMGLEYVCISDEGVYSCLGMIGDWPATVLKDIPDDQWKKIRAKAIERTLQPEDLAGTSLEIIWDCYVQNHKDGIFEEFFSDLKDLPEDIGGSLYLLCDMLDWEPEPEFFETEDELLEAFQEKYMEFTDETWDDMTDDELVSWYGQVQENGPGLWINEVSTVDDETD